MSNVSIFCNIQINSNKINISGGHSFSFSNVGTTGSNRKNGLDQNSSHAMGYTKPFDPINVVSDLSIYSGEQDREKELSDLISPSNSSESGEHFGHSAENSTLIGSELYNSRKVNHNWTGLETCFQLHYDIQFFLGG